MKNVLTTIVMNVSENMKMNVLYVKMDCEIFFNSFINKQILSLIKNNFQVLFTMEIVSKKLQKVSMLVSKITQEAFIFFLIFIFFNEVKL